MSQLNHDQQSEALASAAPDSPDESPSSERKQNLLEQANGNWAKGYEPYDGVAIHTRGELQWILDEWPRSPWSKDPVTGGARHPNLSGARFESEQAKPEQGGSDQQSNRVVDLSKMRLHRVDFTRAHLAYADLHDILLEGAILRHAYLYKANMDGAHLEATDLTDAGLWKASLKGAILSRTKLRGAHLSRADLSGALLWKADLRHAYLHGTNLTKAHLTHVDLRGTHLSKADLLGARLTGSTMDETTEFRDVKLDDKTELRDVVWGGVDLAHVNWDQFGRLGNERAIHDARRRLHNHRQEYKTR
jgi:uncharacterized protein YjbI with pentapeptide repeats